MEGKQLWERMSVTRGDEELGTLHEMRLALQFGMNESDFAAQLTFSEGRDRGSKAGRYGEGGILHAEFWNAVPQGA